MLLDKLQRQNGRRELPAWWRAFHGHEMPLGPYMIHTVVRIIGDWRDPSTGMFTRRARGTGFYVRVPSEVGDGHYTYVVTAHHVIDGQPKLDLIFPDPYNPGQVYSAQPTEGPDWKQPIKGVDLAVLPFARPDGFWVNALELGKNILPGLPCDALLGMPFHYVGLLETHDRAMARSGTLGAIYQTGIEHTDDYEYVCHLADCRSYKGFSGSPCFLEIAMPGLEEVEPPLPPEPGLGKVGHMKYAHPVCGLVTEHLEPPGNHPESSLLGIVKVLPNDYIWKALMESPELVKERQEKDAMPSESEAVPKKLSTTPDEREPPVERSGHPRP
jgi:hypothetical protein